MHNPVDLQRPEHVPRVALAGELSGGAELVDRCLRHRGLRTYDQPTGRARENLFVYRNASSRLVACWATENYRRLHEYRIAHVSQARGATRLDVFYAYNWVQMQRLPYTGAPSPTLKRRAQCVTVLPAAGGYAWECLPVHMDRGVRLQHAGYLTSETGI